MMYNLSQLKDEENCNNKNFNWLRKCIAFFSLKKKNHLGRFFGFIFILNVQLIYRDV